MLKREVICCINFSRGCQPPTHPNAASLVVAHVLRHWAATRSLSMLTKKNLRLAAAYRAQGRRFTPVPGFLPAELFKPCKTLLDVRDAKYRRQTFKFHVIDLSISISIRKSAKLPDRPSSFLSRE